MEGCWTVYVCTGCGLPTGRHKDCDALREAVPVVPCDDAAVDRAAYALACLGNCGLPWAEIREQDREGWRARAQAVLRAAGSVG